MNENKTLVSLSSDHTNTKDRRFYISVKTTNLQGINKPSTILCAESYKHNQECKKITSSSRKKHINIYNYVQREREIRVRVTSSGGWEGGAEIRHAKLIFVGVAHCRLL